jgi:hypothetical protein
MLDPSADEMRNWGNSVMQLMTEYLGDLRDHRVYGRMSSREIRGRLDSALPTKGIDFDGLLKVFRETIIPFSRQNAHPRMFGYVQSPGTALAAFAVCSPPHRTNLWSGVRASSVELERLTIDWIRQILGFNGEACGSFCRRWIDGQSHRNRGAPGQRYSSGRFSVYVSRDAFSIAKAAALLGSRAGKCIVDIDGVSKSGRTISFAKITADLEAGYVPFCVVANAEP